MLGQSSTPLSGGALGRAVGVSRQVVVQDIALLRTEGHPVLATARGYVLEVPHQTERLFKMCHTTEQTREELNTIVDLGGEVLDVMVNHRIYGKVSAPLNIRSRRDVEAFVENIRTGRSTPLLTVTSGYHFLSLIHICGETAVVKFVNAMSGGDNPTPTPDPTPDHNGGGSHGGHGGGSSSGSKKRCV